MGGFLGVWALAMVVTFPAIAAWISALLNLKITKNLKITQSYRGTMLLALALHALTLAPFAALLMWGTSR